MTDSRFALDPKYQIYYCPTLMGRCIDESLTDPTLVTLRVGNVFQRVASDVRAAGPELLLRLTFRD